MKSPDIVTVTPVGKHMVVVQQSGQTTDVVETAPASLSSDKTYIHNQSVPSAVWTIHHNLQKIPSIVILDSANTCVVGDVDYPDNNTAIVRFSGAFSGRASCN